MESVLVAFSGGLDTSYCVKYLSEELGMEVHTALVQTGGFSDVELETIERRALDLGAASHKNIDVTWDFYDNCLKYLVFGNVLRNNSYPLCVSAERVFQAIAIANYAKDLEVENIAHGSTGAGNDQIRFDMVFGILYPEAKILTPIRDQQLSREQEIDFLTKHGVDRDFKAAEYSINKGLWGTSVGGKETLRSRHSLPEEAWPTAITKRPDSSEEVVLYFQKGELQDINNNEFDNPIHSILELNDLAAPYGIGRDIHVGDTIIGIKGRVGFEAAAPLLIIKAHHALEKHILTKHQLQWKDQLASQYGAMVHEGQLLEPGMRNIEAFLKSTQKHVSGEVYIKLGYKHFEIIGIESDYDLMSPEFGAYGEMNQGWTGEDARGFARLLSNQVRIHEQVRQKNS